MSSRNRRFAYVLFLLCLWLLAPEWVYADNCSSLNDCYYTLRAALAAAVGLGVFAGFMTLGLDLGPLVDSLKRKLNGPGSAGVDSAGDEAEQWARSLGVVSVQDPAGAAQSARPQRQRAREPVADRGGTDGARSREGGERAQPRARDGREAQETAGSTQEAEAPAASRQSEPPGETELAQTSRKSAAAEQSAEPAHGSEQLQHESRTPDQARQTGSEAGDAAPGREGGRAPGAGDSGVETPPGGDGADVADRAQEVAEAFGEAQESAGAGEQAQRPEAASRQAERPMEQAQRPAEQAEAPDELLAEDQQRSLQAERPPGQDQSAQATPEEVPAEHAPAGRYGGRGKALAEALGDELAGEALDDLRQIAGLQGSQRLLDAWPLSSPPAMLGALAEARYAARLLHIDRPVAAIAQRLDGRRAVDILLQDGTVVEVKVYDWSGAYFLQPDNVQEAGRRLVRQTEWLRQRHPGQALQVAFSDLPNAPGQLVRLLQSVGVEVSQAPPSGMKKARLADAWTPDAYWDGLDRAGWLAQIAPQRRPALRSLLAQTLQQGAAQPWLALADVVLDSESVYELHAQGESYHAHLTALAQASSGLFRPANVRNAVTGANVLQVSFDHGRQRYRLQTAVDSDYIDQELLAVVNRAVGDAGEEKRLTLLPAIDQLMYLVWVAPQVYERALALGLVPGQVSRESS